MPGPGPRDAFVGESPPRRRVTDGAGRDYQTLVVGDGVGALATAGFLDQAGLATALAPGPGGRPEPESVALWRPGLELLERVGMRRPVEAVGTPQTELRCVDPSGSWSGEGDTRPPLVALRRGRLEPLMRQHLADRIHEIDRPAVSVEPAESGVRVTFEGGVSEPFDAVASARRTLLPDHAPAGEPASAHWWSADWPESAPEPEAATEAWGADCAAFAVPVAGSTRALLVSDRAPSPSPLSLAGLADKFGALPEPFCDAVSGLDRSTLQYGRTPRAAPDALCADGVALVGPASHAPLPGDCLGPSLSVEDGWVLADALAYGPASLDGALAEYADRRRGRLNAIESAARDGKFGWRDPPDLPEPLRELWARRTLAFSHLTGSAAGDLGSGVPERL